jgi:hypothetical protein
VSPPALSMKISSPKAINWTLKQYGYSSMKRKGPRTYRTTRTKKS